MKRDRYIARSFDQKHWYPYAWSDYLGCYVQLGSEWENPPSFNRPELAIKWAEGEWINSLDPHKRGTQK